MSILKRQFGWCISSIHWRTNHSSRCSQSFSGWVASSIRVAGKISNYFRTMTMMKFLIKKALSQADQASSQMHFYSNKWCKTIMTFRAKTKFLIAAVDFSQNLNSNCNNQSKLSHHNFQSITMTTLSIVSLRWIKLHFPSRKVSLIMRRNWSKLIRILRSLMIWFLPWWTQKNELMMKCWECKIGLISGDKHYYSRYRMN